MQARQSKPLHCHVRDNRDFTIFWTYWSGLPKKPEVPQISDYLDNAPASIQSRVSVIDLYSPTKMSIRLIGTLLTDTIGELTGTDLGTLYMDDIRSQALNNAWTSVHWPCGYIVKRTLKTKRGLIFDSLALTLPISTNRTDCYSLITYNDLSKMPHNVAREDTVEVVQAYGQLEWWDIGNGVPEQS